MTAKINHNRVKVTAAGTDTSTDFVLGSAVESFASFKAGTVTYTALADDGTWQVGVGEVLGINLTRGTIEENHLGTTTQVDFTGKELQIAMTLSAEYIDTLTDKLDGIEDNATTDMTGSEIAIAYEAEPDTNRFSDANLTKLDGIEDGATTDQTGPEIKNLYEAEPDTNAFTDADRIKLDGSEALAKDDQLAIEVPFTPTATVVSTDAQNAIEEVDFKLQNHVHPSSIISYIADGDAGALPPVEDDELTSNTELQLALLDHSNVIRDKLYPATGLISGGKLYGNISTTFFSIAAGECIFATNYEEDRNLNKPSKSTWGNLIDISVSPEVDGLSVARLHILLSINGSTVTVVKVSGELSIGYLKDYVYLGRVSTLNGVVTSFSSTPVVAYQAENNINELMANATKITGNDLMPVTGALSFWQNSGNIYMHGVNWHDTDHTNPNKLTLAQVGSDIAPVTFVTINQAGTIINSNNTVLPAEYDDGTVLTPIPATKATIHRMYITGIVSSQRTFILMLGQHLYDSAELAKDAISSEVIVFPLETDNMQLIGFVGATAESVDFSDDTSAWIVSDISSIVSAAGGAGAVTIDWGEILGLLSDQSDLQNALDAKKDTFTENTGFNKNFGTTTGTVCQGDDSRLSDTRTPIAHTHVEVDITDLDKYTQAEIDAALALKKDAFTENTGFNLDLGSIAGTVSEGNHNHDGVYEPEIAVKNTAFNKDFGTATGTVCEGDDSRLTNIKDELILSDVTGSEPTHIAGQMFYADGGINFHGEYSGVTLQVGKEQYIEVINATGAIIPNGKAVYYTGISQGTPAVDLAQADSFATANVLGITTMEIGIGLTGLVTTFGGVSDVNTNGFTPGATLYLSDTVAGDFVESAPDIATSIGSALVIDVLVGKIFVRVNNLVNLPNILAYLSGGNIVGNVLDNTYRDVANYTSSGNVVITFNASSGEVTIPTTGIYKLTINVGMIYDAIGNSEETASIRVNGSISGNTDLPIQLPRNSAAASAYPSINFSAVAGEIVKLQVACTTDTLSGFSFSLMSYDIESKHIR